MLLKLGHRVLVVAELPADEGEFNKVVGTAKCQSSSAIRKALPGRVWGRDDKHDMLRERPYQINAVKYVRNKQGPQAAVWCVDGLRREAKKE